MKIVVGQVARGDNFFDRPKIIRKIWRKLEDGSHVSLAAPRRVGKTSIMNAIQDNPKEGYHMIYVITESSRSENEYYKTIAEAVLESDCFSKAEKAKIRGNDFLKICIKSVEEVGMEGVKLKDSGEPDYCNYLKSILKKIDSSKLVIMVDEYPQTIGNIMVDYSDEKAKHLLQTSREIRQDKKISENVQFIYTGSISLNSIARNLDATKFINDLNEVKVTALREDEAKVFIDELMRNLEFGISGEVRDYILKKIEWKIPFYIQLMISELRDVYDDNDIEEDIVDDVSLIDEAFENAVEKQNCHSTWKERLKVYSGQEYDFIVEILNTLSERKELGYLEIYDISVKYEMEDKCKETINILEHDGYIHDNEHDKIYVFNSPILREWWCRYGKK